MKFHPLSARFLFFKKAKKIGQKIKISPYPFSPHFHGSFMDHAILPTRIQTITICQMMTMMMTYCSNLMAMTLDSMAYLKNNDGNARRYYLRSTVDQYLFIYSIFSFGSTVFIL